MEYRPGELATALESVAVIRSRFRCGHAFIQWPVPVCLVEEDEKEEEWEHHPVCTKSLQLNVDAITTMVAIFHGCFVDIFQLQEEAGPWAFSHVFIGRQYIYIYNYIQIIIGFDHRQHRQIPPPLDTTFILGGKEALQTGQVREQEHQE